MRRFWPKSLAGQLVLLILLALVFAQTIAAVIFLDERRQAIRAVTHQQVLVRTVSIVRLLADTPAQYHDDILNSAISPRLHLGLDDEPIVPSSGGANPLRERLRQILGPAAREIRVEVVDRPWRTVFREREEAHHADDDRESEGEHEWHWRDRHHSKMWDRRPPPWKLGLQISILLPDERWLNVVTKVPLSRPWAMHSFVSLFLLAALLILVVVLTVRRLTRPLQRLAGAAESFGRGEAVDELPEAGPAEVRRTTQAFNRMRERLQRFIGDRMRMLAAVSHDLRTPITSLRLQAEFIEDEENKAKIVRILDEMQRMTEELLAFIREDAAREENRRVDLAALIESLCQDLQDLGLDARMSDSARTPYACRPAALRRAIRNLIENAVRYGGRARLELSETADDHVIEIEDEGPGIPEADFERVFEPFVRLEASRSEETGGIGLGLAIARSIVRDHGGDIGLENRTEGGLRVRVRLPKTKAD